MNAAEGFKRIARALSIGGWISALGGTVIGIGILTNAGDVSFDMSRPMRQIVGYGLPILGWFALFVIQLGLWITRGFLAPRKES
jgi:hypothetical protein